MRDAPLVWKILSVSHGTLVRMKHHGKFYQSSVKNGKIEDDEGRGRFSPNQWAEKITGSPRNAWICLEFEIDGRWIKADALRSQAKAEAKKRFLDDFGSKMPDTVTNELILEHLKRIQNKLSEHDERFTRIESEMRSIKAHLAGLVQSDLTRDADHATIQSRLDRIERRLDLADSPAE